MYRATLTPAYGGREVAIKVQRPDLRASIALDLYLMRALALYIRHNMPLGAPLSLLFVPVRSASLHSPCPVCRHLSTSWKHDLSAMVCGKDWESLAQVHARR